MITKDATVVGINTLVQRVVKDGITNYFALGVSQIREILAKDVPEIGQGLFEPGKIKAQGTLPVSPNP